jgi:transposase
VQARANWQTDPTAGVGGIAPERLVFLDESAVLTNMARRYGRSPRGQRATAKVPFGNWKRLSVLSALGLEGVLATMSVEDATDGATFAAYLEQVLLPVLRERKPDAVLVMDNLRPHKTPEVQAVLDGSGFPYRYLPSYSPDLSPIEPGWAKVKVLPAPGRRAHRRGAATGACSRSRQHHRSGCRWLLPTLRLCLSQLTCGLL